MIPTMTCFNGAGSEHTFSGFHVPIMYYTQVTNKKGNAFLCVMEFSKRKVVWAWHRDRHVFGKSGAVGLHHHSPILKDRKGRYFTVNGNKIRI